VGCGTGEDAVDIAAMGFEYCGLDVAEAAILDAKTKNKSNSSQFACADFFKWQAGQSFDVIYEKGFFHGLAGLRRRSNFIRRIATQLAPDGVWISVCGAADQKHTKFPHGAIYLRDLIMPAEVYFEVLEVVKDNYGLADHEREFRAWHSVFRRY